MPSIPVWVRILLTTIGLVATVATTLVSDLIPTLALALVGLFGFTAAIDWKHPIGSALATAVSGFPTAIMAMALLDAAGLSEYDLTVGSLTVLVFFVTACFAGALAGYTFRTVPRRRWLVAALASVLMSLLVLPSFLLQPEQTVIAPSELPMSYDVGTSV